MSIAYTNSTPLLTWVQGTDGDIESSADFTVHSATWDGSSWSAPQQIAKPISADEFLRHYRTPRSSNAIQISLPKPPEECCKKCPQDGSDPNCETPKPPEPPAATPIDDEISESVEALDPNEKMASPGLGDTYVISPSNRIQYTIYFENVITATAPAQEVFITDQLSIELDWNTIRFEEVAFDQTIVAIDDEGGNQFHTRQEVTDYRSGDNRTWWVDATGILDSSSGLIEWSLRTLDPATGDLPQDTLAGFLPPNDDTKRGEGHVTFSILPKEETPLGTEIRNRAYIIFDTNDAIVTNEVFNLINTTPGTLIYLPIVSK